MRGVYGKPYIDVESIIGGIDSLDLLEIDMGIAEALALGLYNVAYYGAAHDPAYKTLYEYMFNRANVVEENPVVEQFRKRTFDSNKLQNAWKYFCKLRYGVYSATSAILLRGFTNIYEFDRESVCYDTEAYALFPSIKRFCAQLKQNGTFKEIGKVTIFVVDHNGVAVEHVDHNGVKFESVKPLDAHQEFIWLCPKGDKTFYIRDYDTKQKTYVAAKAVWFNSYDKHGSEPSNIMTWSLRLDGVFTEDFKTRMKNELV